MIMFLAELNGLQSWSTDIGNAYLESYTKEKIFIMSLVKSLPPLVWKAMY